MNKPSMRGMRTDFQYSTKPVPLPSASLLGYGKGSAKLGDWIGWQMPNSDYMEHGRVLGRVTAEDVGVNLMVAAFDTQLSHPMMRWVKPEWVRFCNPLPPRTVMEFMCSDIDDVQAFIDTMERGFLNEVVYKEQRERLAEPKFKPGQNVWVDLGPEAPPFQCSVIERDETNHVLYRVQAPNGEMTVHETRLMEATP